MCSLALIATAAGTARERVTRVARYAWPKPPWPSRLSIRYLSRVSGLVMTCWGRSSALPRAAREAEDIPTVVALVSTVIGEPGSESTSADGCDGSAIELAECRTNFPGRHP